MAASRQPFGDFFSGVDVLRVVVFFVTAFLFTGVLFFAAAFFLGLVAVDACVSFTPCPALTRLRARWGLAVVAVVFLVVVFLPGAMMLLLWLGVVFADPNTGTACDT